MTSEFLNRLFRGVFRQGLAPRDQREYHENSLYAMCVALRRGVVDVTKIAGRKEGLSLLEQRAKGTFRPYGRELPEDLAQKLLRRATGRG